MSREQRLAALADDVSKDAVASLLGRLTGGNWATRARAAVDLARYISALEARVVALEAILPAPPQA